MNQSLSYIDQPFTSQYKGLWDAQQGIAEQLAILQGVFLGPSRFGIVLATESKTIIRNTLDCIILKRWVQNKN
jgi:hypothetical protein